MFVATAAQPSAGGYKWLKIVMNFSLMVCDSFSPNPPTVRLPRDFGGSLYYLPCRLLLVRVRQIKSRVSTLCQEADTLLSPPAWAQSDGPFPISRNRSDGRSSSSDCGIWKSKGTVTGAQSVYVPFSRPVHVFHVLILYLHYLGHRT